MAPIEMEERHCPLCNGVSYPAEDAAVFVCGRCGSSARFHDAALMAMDIPRYHLRLEELARRERELVALIEAESRRGAVRDMTSLRSLHEERRRVLSEYSFLTHFQQFIDRW